MPINVLFLITCAPGPYSTLHLVATSDEKTVYVNRISNYFVIIMDIKVKEKKWIDNIVSFNILYFISGMEIYNACL